MESRIAKNVNVRCGAALRRVEEIRERLGGCVRRRMAQAHMRLMNEKGQGTTEYAILVGVLTGLDSVLEKNYEVRGLPCFQ